MLQRADRRPSGDSGAVLTETQMGLRLEKPYKPRKERCGWAGEAGEGCPQRTTRRGGEQGDRLGRQPRKSTAGRAGGKRAGRQPG